MTLRIAALAAVSAMSAALLPACQPEDEAGQGAVTQGASAVAGAEDSAPQPEPQLSTSPAPESGSLAERLAEQKAGGEIPDEVRETMASELARLRQQGIS